MQDKKQTNTPPPRQNMGFKKGFCIPFVFRIAQDPHPRTSSQRDPFNKDHSIFWPVLQASASSRLQTPADNNTATSSLCVRDSDSAYHFHGTPSVNSLNSPFSADSGVPDFHHGPSYALSHSGALWSCTRLSALTSFQFGGRTGTYRCVHTAEAPGQTQGPEAPAHPGGSSAGHSSVLAAEGE